MIGKKENFLEKKRKPEHLLSVLVLALVLVLSSSPPPPYIYLLSIGGRGVKNHATSSLFHYFFNIKFIDFFSKTYLTKSVRNVKIAFLYIIKHVKILSYKVTKLHFMYDIYMYIYKGGG
jgi:hypothetical protein